MWEIAAFGFVALVWWTWPCIAACVLVSVWLAMRSHGRAEAREYAASGPHPCFAHMGKDGDLERWCFRQEGHDDGHRDQFGYPADEPEPTDYMDLFVGDPYGYPESE